MCRLGKSGGRGRLGYEGRDVELVGIDMLFE